jgi:uncharacterized protein YecE (DUF72 family)
VTVLVGTSGWQYRDWRGTFYPPEVRVAVEPRHESWWTGQVRDVLAARNAALCWADRTGTAVTPLWRTADWGYLRFHQGHGAPWPRYRAATLGSWAARIAATWAEAWTSSPTSTTTRAAPRPGMRRRWPPRSLARGGR